MKIASVVGRFGDAFRFDMERRTALLDHTSKVGRAISEGAIWDKRRGERDTSVQIIRTVDGRIGPRLLVRGLKTGREWAVNPETLLSAYHPRTTKKNAPAIGRGDARAG